MSETPNDRLMSPFAITPGAYQQDQVGAFGTVSNSNSTAMVQVRQNMVPMQFHTIRLNTDLNHLPHDWAKTKFQGYGFNNSHEDAFSRFRSVNLAHSYKDLVGKVDVISSSKNIKDLLKMPYQQSPHISLMVHRLGKTLLLEEFDVHKNLLRKDAEDWRWLKDFYHTCMNKQDDKNSSLALLDSPKKDPLTDVMYMNLIRHSITASVGSNVCIPMENVNLNEVPRSMPHKEEESQDLKGFRHESLWTFHDKSKILVDSNLPIFGTDSKSPCISLRLRDSPTINVLTGIDYWLDNLMSNVPEVAMVYHLNGFVQKYEILRTEDIPNLENSSFDPEEVMELAQNVMAFIKSRAVVEGHTYWLYMGEKRDCVKLYDLTEYCKNELRTDDNPFTVPVGLLCYHVGRNCKIQGHQRRSADCRAMFENCLRLLVEESHPQICADAHFLLSDMWVPDKSLHDVWDNNGKIADTPDDLYDEDDLGECDSGPTNSTKADEGKANNVAAVYDKRLSPQKSPRKRDEKNEVAVQELIVRGMIKHKAWDVVEVSKIAGETDKRCREALGHIRKGLKCIDKDLAKLSHAEPRASPKSPPSPQSVPFHKNQCHTVFPSSHADIERDQVRVAKPFVPIPLPYSPIKPKDGKNSKTSSSSASADSETASNASHLSNGHSQQQASEHGESTDSTDSAIPWHPYVKLQLLRKAAIAFYILAYQFHDDLKKRGHTLRYIRYGLHCYECLFVHDNHEPDDLEEDLYFHLVYLAAKARSCLELKIWESSRKDFEELNEEEAAILHSAQAILQKPKEAWIYEWSSCEKENLATAKKLYQKVFQMRIFDKKPLETRNTVTRQYGILLLNTGRAVIGEINQGLAQSDPSALVLPLMGKCQEALEESISSCLGINDRQMASQSVICLTRMYDDVYQSFKGHFQADEISNEENAVLEKLIEVCNNALGIFVRDERGDQFREEAYSRLRNVYFEMAARHFVKCHSDMTLFKKTKDLLYKSLSYCFNDPGRPQVSDSLRIGAIVSYNLARFCKLESMRHSPDSTQHRSLRRKMSDHLDEALRLYAQLKWSLSQIMVKRCGIEAMMEERHTRTLTLKAEKKYIRRLLLQCCDLQGAVDIIHMDEVAKADDCQCIESLLAGVKVVLDLLIEIFKLWLKCEKNHAEVRQLFLRALNLTRPTQVEFVAYPLSQILTDVKELVSSDRFVNNNR